MVLCSMRHEQHVQHNSLTLKCVGANAEKSPQPVARVEQAQWRFGELRTAIAAIAQSEQDWRECVLDASEAWCFSHKPRSVARKLEGEGLVQP